MKRIIIFLILLASNTLCVQAQPDYKTLAKACELWGLIKYFHPSAPGYDFDSAFAVMVPDLMVNGGEDHRRKIISKWLDVLNDPNTNVVTEQYSKLEVGQLKTEFTADSVLIVTIPESGHLSDYVTMGDFFTELKNLLHKAKGGIIFDLRQAALIPTKYTDFIGKSFYYLNENLASPIVPQYKIRYYTGFKAEMGQSSQGYKIHDEYQKPIDKGSFGEEGQKAVWIVNKYSELPIVALSQQASGAGIIINDSKNILGHIPLSVPFSFSENIFVNIKVKDIEFPNGFHPVVNYQYKETEDPIRIGMNLLSGFNAPKQETTKLNSEIIKDKRATYPSDIYPIVGYRILAAAKIFTIIENFFPYYDYMDEDWRIVLEKSLPDFLLAQNEIEYGLAVAKMYAHIQDSHGYIYGNKALLQFQGEAPTPVVVDWIEDQLVITQFRNDSISKAKQISIGDIVTKINGVEVGELMKKYEIYFAHSTKAPLMHQSARYIMRGDEGKQGVFMILDKNGRSREVEFAWTKNNNKGFVLKYRFDTIQLLNKNIGYADLTRMSVAQTDAMFEKFKDTKAIIFDMRGYPYETAWSIAPRLTEQKDVPLALFRRKEVRVPKIKLGEILSSTSQTEFIQTVAATEKPKYKGKTIMLINHQAISQSEHTGLFFKAVNNTTFIGSPTVGANGDVTGFQIPGGMFLNFSGQGVWHVDGTQLQRVGLQPDVPVMPTVKGIREGKDEVLDKAIEWVNINVR